MLRDRRFILPNAWAKWRLYATTWRMYMPNVECTVTRKKIHESILVIFGIILAWILGKLRNTSWKVRAYGIYALVVFVSEIKWVSAATSTWYFWYMHTYIHSLLVTCLIVLVPIGTRLSRRQSSFWWPFYFKSFQNAKISHYTPRNDNEIEVTAY